MIATIYVITIVIYLSISSFKKYIPAISCIREMVRIIKIGNILGLIGLFFIKAAEGS